MDRPSENDPVPSPEDSDVSPPAGSPPADGDNRAAEQHSQEQAAVVPVTSQPDGVSHLEEETADYDNEADDGHVLPSAGDGVQRIDDAAGKSDDDGGKGGYAAVSSTIDEDWEEDEDKPSGGILPADFWNHVEDLRWVLIKSALAFFGAMLLMMVFSVRAQKLLIWPLEYGLRLSGSQNTDILLRTDGPFSVFTFMLQLWVFGGLLLSLPFILYFSAGFIAPGLTPREKKLLRPVAFSALGLFLVGCLFAFFLLLPTYIAVSLSLEKVFGFASLWTPSNYYGAVVWTTLGMGIVFQFPLVLLLLQYLGLVTAATLRNYRRHAFVFILIFAALLTPGGDPISLAICTIPLYALFELSMVVGERIRKRTAVSEEDEYED